jgi:hypothetical protein
MRRQMPHWLAIAGVLGLMILDHLPAQTPDLVLAAWNGTPTSEWDSLPIMYD